MGEEEEQTYATLRRLFLAGKHHGDAVKAYDELRVIHKALYAQVAQLTAERGALQLEVDRHEDMGGWLDAAEQRNADLQRALEDAEALLTDAASVIEAQLGLECFVIKHHCQPHDSHMPCEVGQFVQALTAHTARTVTDGGRQNEQGPQE